MFVGVDVKLILQSVADKIAECRKHFATRYTKNDPPRG